MVVNDRESSILIQNLLNLKSFNIRNVFPFRIHEFENGIKYLGYHLKYNFYRKVNWSWLITKIKKKGIKVGVLGGFLELGGLFLINQLWRLY